MPACQRVVLISSDQFSKVVAVSHFPPFVGALTNVAESSDFNLTVLMVFFGTEEILAFGVRGGIMLH